MPEWVGREWGGGGRDTVWRKMRMKEKAKYLSRCPPTLTSFSSSFVSYFLSLPPFPCLTLSLHPSSPNPAFSLLSSALVSPSFLPSSNPPSAEWQFFTECGRQKAKGVKNCSCLVAAITNYHKCGGLKLHKFILTQFQRPKVWTWVVGRSACPLEAVGEDPPLPLPAPSGSRCPWVVAA